MKKSKNKFDLSRSDLKPEEFRITFTDRFIAFTFKLLKGPSTWLNKKMPQLRDDIMKSNLAISPEALISLVFFFTIIGFIPTILGIFTVLMYRWIFGLFLLPIAPLIFAIGIATPKLSQSSRSGALDHELPFVIGYMTTLAGGGISPFVTLKRLSNVDLYPATAKEAKRILMDIDVFGMDPISALDKAAKNIPNKAFSDFLGGYNSVLKSGGDVVSYMETKLRDTFSYRTIKMKNAVETIGTFAEVYIALAVILGISFFVLFAVQSILGGGLGGGGSSMSLNNVVLFSTLFIPLISIMFIYFVHSVQSREPFTYYKPYLIFSASLWVIVLMVFLPQFITFINIPFYTWLSLGLIISVVPAAIISYRDSSHKRAVESMLSSFLADIAEIRKTGLAPERCIEQLAERKYGKLSIYVKNMSTQLSWGVPLRKVMINFSNSVRSWLVRATAFILLEVVDVGGGTVKMFGSLADFSQKINETEKQKKSALRPFIFIPYFGAIMIVVTMIMMIYFVTLPMTALPGSGVSMVANLPLITSTLLSSAILQAWIMGFVAGKMGEGNIAAGFKHSAILVIISLVAIYITNIFFPLPS
ncbi:MAG: type II secretion system F family protein [archaeon]|nr:type II secretion system F family protein [archaeon]